MGCILGYYWTLSQVHNCAMKINSSKRMGMEASQQNFIYNNDIVIYTKEYIFGLCLLSGTEFLKILGIYTRP